MADTIMPRYTQPAVLARVVSIIQNLRPGRGCWRSAAKTLRGVEYKSSRVHLYLSAIAA